MRRLLVALALTPLLAPAAANAQDTWQPRDSGAPTTVSFSDIATTELPATADHPAQEVVIAVGQDTVTNTTTNQPTTAAVIYRLAAGAWSQDVVTLPSSVPAGTASELDSVSIAGGVAWAVGSAGTAPLTLRLGSDDLRSGLPATWTSVAGGTGPLHSVSLTATPSGATGYVAAADGAVYPVDDNGTGTFGTALDMPPNASVKDVVTLSAGEGFAAGAQGTPPGGRFIQITAQAPKPVPMPAVDYTSTSCGHDIQSVDALSASNALAIDSACIWTVANGAWTQAPNTLGGLSGMTQSDVDLAAATGTTTLAAIAGRWNAVGVVWRQDEHGVWTRDETTMPPLNAVSIAGADDIWAAGESGTIAQYAPAPVVIDAGSGDGGGSGDPGSGGGTGGGGGLMPDGGSSQPSADPAPDTGTADPGTPATSQSAGSTTITIDQPKAKPKRKRHRRKRASKPVPPARLMTDVAVKKVKGGLVLTFNLTAPAQVSIIASRNQKVVGKADAGTLPKGPNKLVLHYKGTRPSDIKIVVRPAKKTGSGVK